ncbi:unnamed protein product [Urochloa humidicola]
MGRKRNRRRSIPAMPNRSRRAEQTSTRTRRTKINDLSDDLLELVLRRISSPFCLVRAASTCKRWRRVLAPAAADNDFLRRLHPQPPHILGHFYDEGRSSNTTIFVPAASPEQPGEAPINISLDFLAGHYSGTMALSDGRGRLLAFVHSSDSNSSSIVVCNPCTREHRELKPPRYGYWQCTIGAFLLAGTDNNTSSIDIDMACFRVLCVWLDREKGNGNKTAHAATFSAREDCWEFLGSAGVSSIMPNLSCWLDARTKFLGRAGGSLCWSGEVSDTVLHLDESSGVFSIITLPAAAIGNRRTMSYNRGNLRVVGGSAGVSVRLARVVGNDLVEVLRWRHYGGDEFMVERKVCLPRLPGMKRVDSSWRFLDTAETAVMSPGRVVLLPDEEYTWMFSLDIGTMKMKGLHKRNSHAHRVFPYELPWPPTIKVCV